MRCHGCVRNGHPERNCSGLSASHLLRTGRVILGVWCSACEENPSAVREWVAFRYNGASCPRGKALICRGCCPFVPQPALQPINLNHLVVTTGLFIPFNMTTFRFLDVLFHTLGDIDWSLCYLEVNWTSVAWIDVMFHCFSSHQLFVFCDLRTLPLPAPVLVKVSIHAVKESDRGSNTVVLLCYHLIVLLVVVANKVSYLDVFLRMNCFTAPKYCNRYMNDYVGNWKCLNQSMKLHLGTLPYFSM